MLEKHFATLDETLCYEKMSNGLDVYLLNKPGFSKTYGIFATRFGSVDTTFVPLGETEMVKVPDGVAHFLEHKMFAMKDEDVMNLFSRLGANTNAFTAASKTAYLFLTSSNVPECTSLLLDFVQDIYLTAENVEKEKGIIASEIKMYDDDPDWQSYMGIVGNLYHNHPVATDIAGTVASVTAITKDDLLRCYRTFYHPCNMVLFVIGNIDPPSLMDLIRDNQNKKQFAPAQEITRASINEPAGIKRASSTQQMDVQMPKFSLGIKVDDVPADPLAKIKREFAVNMILDYFFSKSGELYAKWTREGLINDTFGGFFTQERDYAFIQIGGDTLKADELSSRLQKVIANMPDFKMSADDLDRLKRKMIGSYIVAFNSPENIANLFIDYIFEGFNVFEIIDVIHSMTLEDIQKAAGLFDPEKLTTHLIVGK